MKIFIPFLVLLFLIKLNISYSQDTIYLNNSSFEDIPRKGGEPPIPILGWTDCGLTIFPGESPPDIHPVPSKAWEVSNQAVDGNTYLGLVTRYNNTHESLSQILFNSLQAGKCYTISGYVAVSGNYKSGTPRSGMQTTWKGNKKTITPNLENFVKPVRFLIAGGHELCAIEDILVFVGPVSNTEWQQFKIEFTPKENYRFITIGAFYDNPNEESYNGHVLVDGLSPIIEINCE